MAEHPARARPDALTRTPVTALKGAGSRLAERLERLGIHTVADLLFHLPLRYQDRTRTTPIGALAPGEEAVVEGEVELAEVVHRRRRMLVARLSDGTGRLTLRFFHFHPAQQAMLQRGTRLRCFGEVRTGQSMLEMIHPELTRVAAGQPESEGAASLTPIYPTTEGLHQLSLRNLTDQALARLEAAGERGLAEWLPAPVLERLGLPALAEALRWIHRPPPEVSMEQLEQRRHPAQRRLAFEELLAHHLSLRRIRERVQQRAAPPLPPPGALVQALRGRLGFALTDAQERVVGEVAADLAREVPMMRLVQGDVGSGKTVVAAIAALQAVEAGYQVAVMAPTELLAEQHYRNLSGWLEPLGVTVAWHTGKSRGRGRRETLEAIAAGEAAVVVGTHALFSEEVAFHALALVVVDEQHRFGVHQRLALREKGVAGERSPHQLIMTATPIPRTLAMTAYADLDSSAIDELPPGRKPVRTVAVPQARRPEVVERVRAACGEGRQAYWVCTLVEASEALEAQAAADTAQALTEALPELRIGLVHGRMKGAEKEAVMAAFKAGDVDLLVATTVIEVGVDVPNASLMIIDNAERLGLAQLHQLRGRVGRGRAESSCVLLYDGPLSETARARLNALRESTDGFELARRDLELRGPGEVLGTRQAGMLNLKVADLLRDRDLLDDVQCTGERLRRDHPDSVEPLVRRWLGEAAEYGTV